MYAAMNEQQGGAANPGAEGAANAEGNKGENVTDVDYEEVK